MDPRKAVEGLDLAALFAAGAASALRDMDVSEKQAEEFVLGICKKAAYNGADYDDEDDTFWGRNKSWLLPTIVGALAFRVGAESAKSGAARPDRTNIGNAAAYLGRKLDILSGRVLGPLQSALSISKAK